jgi:hypothetical protein
MADRRPGLRWTVRKDWSAAQAMAAQKRAIDADPALENSPATPFFQWATLLQLDQLERDFRGGDRFALMMAIHLCAWYELVIPDWAAKAFMRAFRRVNHCDLDSWDEAFGRPYPKGFHLKNARQNRALRPAIYLRVKGMLTRRVENDKIIEPMPLGDGLFEVIGKEFGVGKTRANKLYYEARAMFGSSLPRNPRNSRQDSPRK